MTARIYLPAKSPMQSGQAKDRWLLEFDREQAREIEPLMGWTSSGETQSQVRLSFESAEAAIAYAERAGIPYRVERPSPAAPRKGMSYSDNFRFNRVGQWTH